MRLHTAACLALLLLLIPAALAASPGRPVAPKASFEAQPGPWDLYRRVFEDPPLSTFSALLAISGLSGKPKSSKPITVLAPTDQAFAEAQGLTVNPQPALGLLPPFISGIYPKLRFVLSAPEPRTFYPHWLPVATGAVRGPFKQSTAPVTPAVIADDKNHLPTGGSFFARRLSDRPGGQSGEDPLL